ncbi:MAG TPA: hypothetical protein VM510_03305 [Caulifigura sp.]|nr:hypothetical protein [Caulifigura sp.]
MKKFLAVCSVALCATVAAYAADKPECLKEGDGVAAFYVTDVTGPSAGEKLCYRCKYGSKPVVSIFTKQMTDKVAKLTKNIDQQVAANKDAKMAAFVVILTEDPEGQNDALKAVAAKNEIKNTPITTFDGLAGPAEYKIAKDADTTVMMWVDGKVKVNESLKASDLTDEKIAALTKSTSKILN